MTNMIGHSHFMKWLGGCQGACCNSKRAQRKARKSVKAAEKKLWKKDQNDEAVD